MPAHRRRPSLDALAHAQDGIVSRTQVLACGVPADTVDTWVRRGRWQAVLPRVYDTSPGRAGQRQRLRAALLYAGDDAALDGVTAARLHGLRVPDSAEVHVAVPAARQIVGRGFVVVRRAKTLPRVARACLAVVNVETSAVIAAVHLGDPGTALALLAEAVQRGLTTPERLAHVALGAPRHGRAVVNAALGDIVAGCRSAPEAAFRRLVRTRRTLPEPLWNPLLVLPDGSRLSPDAYWPEAALAHEVDSREHHLYGTAWEDTMQRHAALTAAGVTALHSSPRRIAVDGHRLLDELESAYRIGLRRGPAAGVQILRAHAATHHIA